MSEPTSHLGDEIQDLLDGRLDPAREAIVRSHLAECDVCRQEWQQFAWLKQRLRALSDPAAVAADLEPAIRGTLDRERSGRLSAIASVDASSASARARPRVWRMRSALAAGIAALLGLAIGSGMWWFRPPSPAEIASDYVSLAAGALRLDALTSVPGELEREFRAHGDVPARVYDLGMMQYTLVGGRVQRHRGQAVSLAVYRGARGERVICEMYYAPPPSLEPIDRRTHDGIEFTVYRQGDIVMVFWDEGPVTCVLSAIRDPDALIQLAFAKAQRRA